MTYADYVQKMQGIADLRHAQAVLQWDQETYLPTLGAARRGQQLTTLSALTHSLFTAAETGELLRNLAGQRGLNAEESKNIELSLEDYEKNSKYPEAFVRQLSAQVNRAFHAWIEARRQNDFSIYEPELQKLIELKREEAGLLGYQAHPYDALLNDYEKGATVAELDEVFGKMLPRLKTLLDQIASAPQVDDAFLRQSYPKPQQWSWGMDLVKRLGFNMEAGRQDISEHPFSTSFGSSDVRITTRVDEQDLGNMTWSCIHEVGHALYEQGLPDAQYGLPLGEACSYSIHESQSRLWENNVGRGRAFWQTMYPVLQNYFPEQLGKVAPEQFFRGINKVSPSLIRTEADEVSYHFHVYIRYELEKALITGSLQARDIPAFWNEHYQRLLGVTVPDNRRGCLQDVHWSHGSFGYFPTYSLGSFYAAQFYRQAGLEIPGLEEQIASGDYTGLLRWLREKIHAKGRFYTSGALCRQITGESLNPDHFVDYLLDKFQLVYNL